MSEPIVTVSIKYWYQMKEMILEVSGHIDPDGNFSDSSVEFGGVDIRDLFEAAGLLDGILDQAAIQHEKYEKQDAQDKLEREMEERR